MAEHGDGSEELRMFDLNLRLLGDVQTQQKAYLYNEQELELKCAHPCLFPVIENIQALLLFTDNMKRDIAIKHLEQVHLKYPHSINTMENLDCMYRKKGRTREANAISDKLSELKNESECIYDFERARCDLEKAYILLIDLHAETRKTPTALLQEVQRQLRSSLQYRQGSHKAMQQNALDHLQSSIKSIHEAEKCLVATPSNCTVETTHGRKLAEKFFTRGLQKFESSNIAQDISKHTEFLIWKHMYGKACHRIGITQKAIMTTSEKKKYLRNSIELFQDVIEYLKLPAYTIASHTYLIRSYAYLGNMLIIERKVIAGAKEGCPDFIQKDIWEDPWTLFSRGITQCQIFDIDRIFINRLAQTLIKHVKQIPNHHLQQIQKITSSKSQNKFKLAIGLCQVSLDKWPYANWFAHAIQMQAYLDKYRKQYNDTRNSDKPDRGQKRKLTTLPKPDKELLKLARAAGEEVLKLRVTTDTLINVAKTLYYEAIDPDVGNNFKKGRVLENKESLIYRAIDYLENAHDYHDCKNHSRKYALLAKCFFDVGDHIKGIHYIKKACLMEQAMEYSRDPKYLDTVCKFIAETCGQIADKGMKSDLRAQLWLMIEENMRRYKHRIKHTLVGVANAYPHIIIDMLFNVVKQEQLYSPLTKDIFDICMATLKRHKGPRVNERINEVERLLPDDITVMTSAFRLQFRLSSTESSPSESQDGKRLPFHGKEYDFYILCSKFGFDWVKHCFLPLLKSDDQGGNFKYLLSHGDTTNETTIKEMIAKCYRVLIVVDAHFKNDKDCDLESQIICRRLIESKREDDIIPIVREDLLPDHLILRISLDFTKPPYASQLEKLVHVLQDSDMQVNCAHN